MSHDLSPEEKALSEREEKNLVYKNFIPATTIRSSDLRELVPVVCALFHFRDELMGGHAAAADSDSAVAERLPWDVMGGVNAVLFALQDKGVLATPDFWRNLGGQLDGGECIVEGRRYSVRECYEKAMEVRKEEDKERSLKSLELDASTPNASQQWCTLGRSGGGTVNGREYSEKQCCEKALELDGRHYTAWRDLASRGGGTVSGREYSKKECAIRCLEIDPYLNDHPWISLGLSGGGTVNGIDYSNKECYCKALEMFAALERVNSRRAKIIEHNKDHSVVWNLLGNAGGGTVNGQDYSAKQCNEKALQLDGRDFIAWYNLAARGGGSVSGREYSTQECFVKYLEIDPRDKGVWAALGRSGGGTVSGTDFSEKECYEKSLEQNGSGSYGDTQLERNILHDTFTAWSKLGEIGGGTVSGREYSKKECICQSQQCCEKLLELDGRHYKAWCNLASIGGGTVSGREYSKTECAVRCLEIDPRYEFAWIELGTSGGGTVNGIDYSKSESCAKAVEVNENDASVKDGRAWFVLGEVGGGDVNGVTYSRMECHIKSMEKSLELDGSDNEGWSLLAWVGGGTVKGKRYTSSQCCLKALHINRADEMAWTVLGLCRDDDEDNADAGENAEWQTLSAAECLVKALSLTCDTVFPEKAFVWYGLAREGGGTVDGVCVTADECKRRALELDSEIERKFIQKLRKLRETQGDAHTRKRQRPD